MELNENKIVSFCNSSVLFRLFDDFFTSASLSSSIHASFISLILKVVGASRANDFRPISLIHGVYKIVSKVLAARLKKVLPLIISKNQCAFVSGRQILDGFLIASEVIDFHKKAGEGSIKNGHLKGVKVGARSYSFSISHLCFANDTLLLTTPHIDNSLAISRILYCFYYMSGLSVNFHKSMLFGIGVSLDVTQEAANLCCCNIGFLLTRYLGFPLSANSR
ncbi:uncharacterized protein LOC122723839 [Manihot esculenta]|uniref:uncharacterized protein LOC122723839 n=1 Tax=Manihot esculenta TaxID=3983 RepID=UPI001CC82EB4|nr:uncharacterized protein LOC122723839 [Manihot esculenta]